MPDDEVGGQEMPNRPVYEVLRTDFEVLREHKRTISIEKFVINLPAGAAVND